MSRIATTLFLLLATSCASIVSAVPVVPVGIVAEFPHDRHAYTQGIVWHAGRMFESTGLYGRSTLREVELETGHVIRAVALDYREFGEGLTVHGECLFQLTWRNHRALVYSIDGLRRMTRLTYDGEGWGLTGDGTHLYMSDGSATLRVLDPADFSIVRRIAVTAAGEPLPLLNALQWVDGRIFANVWQSTHIAVIDPETGAVETFLDLGPVIERLDFVPDLTDESPNGIAYDAANKRLFVTGKLWPRLFEVRW